jgi:hypothetical protein
LENQNTHSYIIKPASPPLGWNNNGFIYAQISVEGYFVTCIDLKSGSEKSMGECDPDSGDKMRKYGNLNLASKRAVYETI